MKEQSQQLSEGQEMALASYCDVCFMPFERVVPRKVDDGSQVLYCMKCKCKVHKACYDLEANSQFITSKLREFVCQRCSKKELANKACMICHRKDGVLKELPNGKLIHIFCGLTHKNIDVVSYYPEIKLKLSPEYKDVPDKCAICKKSNASDQCAMESCTKKVHGYCVMVTFKQKEQEEDDPHWWKYYFNSGDNGSFDLSHEIIAYDWISEDLDRVLKNFESFGFLLESKEELKLQAYEEYKGREIQERSSETYLKRGGFAYVLCTDHQSSIYCNCFNRGSGEMVLCECCFEWYHQKCVNYNPKKESESFICSYCVAFYELKKKIIEEVRNSKTQNYDLKFDTPKLWLMDFIWLMRVIDHRIAGGAASKMIKEMIKYPLKSSKMELVIRSQNRKKINELTETFIVNYLESQEHKRIVTPKNVLRINEQHKPVNIPENIQYNKKLKDYMKFIEGFSKRNSIPDFFKPVFLALEFKDKAILEEYEVITELLKTEKDYPEIPALRAKAEEYSFMEVLKDINTGAMIRFEDLESAVKKTKSLGNIPIYLLNPLIQRYEKVKSLVQFVTENIKQSYETSSAIEEAVKKLKEELVFPPSIYQTLQNERKIIKDLYLLFLKEEGKTLDQSLDISDKMKILFQNPPCQANKQIAELVSPLEVPKQYVNPYYPIIIKKYLKVAIVHEFKEILKRKQVKLSYLIYLSKKYDDLQIDMVDQQIGSVIEKWKLLYQKWIQFNQRVSRNIKDMESFGQISFELKNLKQIIEEIATFPFSIINRQEHLPQIGSISQLQAYEEQLATLQKLYTEAQLEKNPLTLTKLPHGLSKENPIVRKYLHLKKEQSTLLSKFTNFYVKVYEKIEHFKADPKKQRKQQMKENLQKPNIREISDLIEILKESKVDMESQINELTETINKSLQIAKQVKEFMNSKKLQSIQNLQQLDLVKKQVDELRKKVLLGSSISLDNQFADLYQMEICIRMQKMLLSSNIELDKVNKLLKFAQEQGLTHVPTYQKLKGKFEVRNQTSRQIHLIKKHENMLNNESQKDASFLYHSLSNLRKSLNLMSSKDCQQKNSHIEALIERNIFLRRKIELILEKDPKKYDIQQVRSVFFEALKSPFQVSGLSRLQYQLEKAEKVIKRWNESKDHQSSTIQIFLDYEALMFIIQDIQSSRKSIKDCQEAESKIELMKITKCNLDGLEKIEEILENIEIGNVSKNTDLYYRIKIKYFEFWVDFLKKCQREKFTIIPYSKVKSVFIQCYFCLQKLAKRHRKTSHFREAVEYLEDLFQRIKNTIKRGEYPNLFEKFIDLQDLRFQIDGGLNIDQQIMIYKPFEDLHRFGYIELYKYKEEKTAKRPRVQDPEMQDPYKHEEKHMKVKLVLSEDESKQIVQAHSHFVNQEQRKKIKQILTKNIKKNKELSGLQNIIEQVGLIENQIFGSYHKDIVKYLEMSDLFEKLFIKLVNLPHLSSKVAKKNFQWGFLKLLVQNIQKFSELEGILAQKNKEQDNSAQNQGKEMVKADEEKREQINTKSRNVQDMIATGQLDQSVRKELKKELKAIKENKHKKKKRKHRSRSRSRSPDANFSSESQQIKPSNFVQRQVYDYTNQQHIFREPQEKMENEAALMFDPEDSQHEVKQEEKKNYKKGTILKLKKVNFELNLKKKGKMNLQGFMMSDQDYKKITGELVDPGFPTLVIRKEKTEQQIIQYLNKPSRNRYKFLVGWFEGEDVAGNEILRDFAIETTERRKIYGVQNDRLKMHIMSIRQYIKINKLHDPCPKVSSEIASQALKSDRMMYIVQYPSEKMYQLKGTYDNFDKIEAIEEGFEVQIPEFQQKLMYDQKMPEGHGYMPPYMGSTSFVNQPIQQFDPNQSKVSYEGWNTEESSQMPTINPSYPPTQNAQSYNSYSSNILSRFSPILTDEQNNQQKPAEQKVQKQEIDLASNILNSLNDINLKPEQRPQQNFPEKQQQEGRFQQPQQPQQPQQQFNRFPSNTYGNPNNPNQWYPPQQPHMNPQMQHRPNMPYNPMAAGNKYPPPPPQQSMNMMYKNPMAQLNRYPNYMHAQSQNPQGHPPHSQQPHSQQPHSQQPHSQPHSQNQGQYGSNPNNYDQYGYQRK